MTRLTAKNASSTPPSIIQLVYRVSSTTSRARVAVWRELKRMGTLYIQGVVGDQGRPS
ncbi:hypothetical protein [Nonomuraea lactucae]|uniref:hypothetical protein n=1 Tax=Nonomuraea lactucae TaxID=2249762 RepID=UPI0013B45671|nr:hypothetical protein [Nonomuraea lactucae]